MVSRALCTRAVMEPITVPAEAEATLEAGEFECWSLLLWCIRINPRMSIGVNIQYKIRKLV